MPQIDLGKIRFDWRGTWSSATAYELNDVVTDGTDVYVAIANTVPAATALSNATYWDVMVEGVTTAEIDAAIANLVDSAPATLNTLNELAAALNDDANFATTVTTALSGKANASHTHLLADITDVTATVTELNYVDGVTSAIQTQIDSKVPLAQTVETVGASRALTSADLGKLILNSAAITITVEGLTTGQQVDFLQAHSGQITFAAGSGVTLSSKESKLKTAAQGSPASIKCVATNVYWLVGDLGA